MPIMLNKHLKKCKSKQELHYETSKMLRCLTYLIATLKRLKVAEFTIWTGITGFNFLLSVKQTFNYEQPGLQFYYFQLLPCQSNVW